MPEIPAPSPPQGPEPALSASGLPAEILARLKPGESLAARVIQQMAPGRYLLSLHGSQVTVESRLALSAGQRLSLLVREAGTRVLLDLVSRQAVPPPATSPAGPAGASQAPEQPQATVQQPASAPSQSEAAARTVRVEVQAALARSAPLGEVLSEARRILSQPAQPAPSTAPSAPPPSPAPGTASAGPAAGQQTGAAAAGVSARPAPAQPPPAPPAPPAALTDAGTADRAPAPAAPPAPSVPPRGAPAAPPPAGPVLSEAQAAGILRALTLALPEAEAGLPPQAAAPAEAGSPPPAALAGMISLTPERIVEVLALLEARAAEILAALPGAAALDAVLRALEMLPPPAAEAAEDGAPSPTPPLDAAARQEIARLLDRLLAALSDRAAGREMELPAGLREELQNLGARGRSALRELAAEGERRLAEGSPRLAALGRAHRNLLAAQGRSALARLGSLATSRPGAGFSYVEIPTSCGGEEATARLRVAVRRSADGGRGAAREGHRPVRAVLDISLSALGEVWSELVLTGKSLLRRSGCEGRKLAVRLELPDRQRRDFVRAESAVLEEKLAARGLEAQVTVEAREPAERGLAGELWPEAGESGGLDLWA